MSDAHSVSFRDATKVWAKIGLLGFGGPAGQIALMHKELVEERKWIGEERFLHALNYCMLLPGPEATQLATYVGWLLHKTPGGLVAGTLFVLPGFVAVLALSALYATLHELPAVSALFFGLKAAVFAIVVEAVIRIGRRALRTRAMTMIAALAFVALYFFDVPFPAVVAAAGALGWLASRAFPSLLPPSPTQAANDAPAIALIDRMAERGELTHTRPTAARAIRVLAVGAVVWWAPVVALAAVFGRDSVFVDEAVFFSKAAVVTFGGAYAVLAFVAQRAVDSYHWLLPGEMLDGLGLAETTPGPLILVLQFVGFLGAFREASGLAPLAAGALGAAVTVWVTFVPCFLWIFLGAPYIEALRGSRALSGALSCITAAVVGVIVQLSLWFALHVLFTDVDERHVGPLRLFVPVLDSIDFASLGLASIAMLALFRFELGMPKTLALCAALGIALRFAGA